jgi:hypothetical protein
MQANKLPIRQIALHPKICPVSSYSPTITLRTLSIGPVWNKQSRTLETSELVDSKDPTLLKNADSKLAKDIEKRELQRLRKNEYSRKYIASRYTTDPIWRDKYIATIIACEATRLASDPEFHAKKNETTLKWYHTNYEKDPWFAIQRALRTWVNRVPTTRDRLCWKYHVPVMTTEKVERHCASCHITRRGGTRLVWQRRQVSENDEPLYDCSGCFYKDPATALPEGFEDVKTLQQLYLRRDQLLGIKARRPRKNALPPSPPST